MAKDGKKIKIQQVGSPLRRDGRQRTMLIGLGLNKMNRTREVVDNAATRGMLDKLKHMVRVVED